MLRILSFLLLVAVFGFGGAMVILLALGLGLLVIKLIPFLLVLWIVSIVVRSVCDTGDEYRREYW